MIYVSSLVSKKSSKRYYEMYTVVDEKKKLIAFLSGLEVYRICKAISANDEATNLLFASVHDGKSTILCNCIGHSNE